MASLMPLPLTVSCSSKIQIGFTFLVPADLGSPGQRAVKRMYVRMYVNYTADIDECQQSGRCSQRQRCVNTEGSYTCEGPSRPAATQPTDLCPVGYAMHPDTGACEGKVANYCLSLGVFSSDIMDPASCLHSLLPPPRSTAITSIGSDLLKSFLKSILVPSANVHLYSMVLTTTSKPTFLPCSLFDYLSYY